MKLRHGYHWRPRPWRLSAQQCRVLDLLVEGKTNPEIAAELGITLDGAKWHVSHLLAQTGCERRRELAAWWNREKEREAEPRAAFVPLIGLAKAAGSYAAVLLAAGVVAGLAFLSVRVGGGAGAGPEAAGSVGSTASSPSSVSPISTFVPTSTPQPAQPGAWVFDIESGEVTPLPLLLGFRQWLHGEPARFAGNAGGDVVVADAGGQIVARVTVAAANQPQPVALALQDEGTVLLWRPAEGTLDRFDPETKTESPLAGFGAAPAGGGSSSRLWAITTVGRAIALAEPAGDRVRVAVSALDGSERRIVFEGGTEAWIAELAWSPDGRRLLIRTGPRPASSRDPVAADSLWVVDAAGVILLRQAVEPGGYSWAGPQRLLVQPPASTQASRLAIFLDVPSGTRTPVLDAAGLLCISPDGRLGVFIRTPARSGGSAPVTRHRIVDLASGTVLMDAETSPIATACDWTWNSRRVVISPGGK